MTGILFVSFTLILLMAQYIYIMERERKRRK